MAVVAVAAPHHPKHRQGCRSAACDRRVDRRWAREHRPPPGPLEECIIRNESGGDPQAVNGIYSGIGQWEDPRWLSDGGGRYSHTPLGASYAQQERILRGEGEAGMIEQQGQYDGCA